MSSAEGVSASSTELPSGTITFLFTDIEGSTRLLQELGTDEDYAAALAEHRRLLREAFQGAGGREVDTQGDAFFYAFARASDAVAGALAAQLALEGHAWPEGRAIRVRMGVHTGEAVLTGEGYVGLAVHQGARVMSAGYGRQVLLSQTTGDLVAGTLPSGAGLKDLGEHRLKDLTHPARLFQLTHPGLPLEFPPPKTLDYLPNNLPQQISSFVGRDRELQDVVDLVRSSRLLTLAGAGGTGKTRLALQVAAELVAEMPAGAWLVSLETVGDDSLLAHEVAAALSVSEEPGRTIADSLRDALQTGERLVVLDNCEHLVSAVAAFAETFLEACPDLRILATSREPLGIGGETVYRVPVLAVPDPTHATAEAVAASEAGRLFAQRAASAKPGFALTDENAAAVAEICRTLDGMPLSIELAASRVKMLAPGQIAARLGDRFKLLTGGARTAVARQQSLRAAIDWSYDLLSEQERAVFARLGVFAGFSLEAAEAVASGEGVDEFEVLDLVGQLVDRSLLVADVRDEGSRYRMLSSIRAYAGEKLAESGLLRVVREQHARWFVDAAAGAEDALRGAESAAALDTLEHDLDNLRAALAWGLEEAGRAEALALAKSLGNFWIARGRFAEGRSWLERALATDTGADEAIVGEARRILGRLAYLQGDDEIARAAFEESLAVARRLDDRRGTAGSLTGLGSIAWRRGDLAAARTFFEDSLAVRRAGGDRTEEAKGLLDLATVELEEGRYDVAEELASDGLRTARSSGDDPLSAEFLDVLGQIASAQGDGERARDSFAGALEIHRRLGNRWGEARGRHALGCLLLDGGDARSAVDELSGALAIFRELGNRFAVAQSASALADAQREIGETAPAIASLSTALAIYEELGDTAPADAARRLLDQWTTTGSGP